MQNKFQDRLVNLNDVIEAVDKHTREDETLDEDISVILEEVKTAFDKEKVINEIQISAAGIVLNMNVSSSYAEGYVNASKDIIEIVKRGGLI